MILGLEDQVCLSGICWNTLLVEKPWTFVSVRIKRIYPRGSNLKRKARTHGTPEVIYFDAFSSQGEQRRYRTSTLGRMPRACSFLQVGNVLMVKTDVSFCIVGWYLSALDSVFLAIYFMEIVLKLYALRSFFFKTGWNIMGKRVILLNFSGFWRRDHNLLLKI